MAGFGGGAEFLQYLAGGVEVLVMPDAVIFGHGFAPVGHGEAGIDFLGSTEMSGGIVVFEVVELRKAVEEIRLRGRRTGVGEGDFADGGGLGVESGRAEKKRDCG